MNTSFITRCVLVGVIVGMLVAALSGCSSSLTLQSDLFYPKKYEPRVEMPWYGGVNGDSNKHWFKARASSDGFEKLGGD